MRHDLSTLNNRGVNNAAFELTLDGEAVRGAVAFDVEEGWVDRYVQDANGRIQTEGEGNDQRVKVERLHGNVQAFLTHSVNGKWQHLVPEPAVARLSVTALIDPLEDPQPDFFAWARKVLAKIRDGGDDLGIELGELIACPTELAEALKRAWLHLPEVDR